MISICLATYNGEKYLYDTLLAVQQQTYTDFECIIVDDHSTDNTLNILSSFAKNDDRFKVFINLTDKSKPYVDAHNKSYELASGELLFRIDQDDIMKHDLVEKCVLFMKENPSCDAVSTYNTFFEIEDGVQKIIDYIPDDVMNERANEFNSTRFPLELYNSHPDAWFNQSSCMRKTFYDEHCPKFTMTTLGDIIFWWSVFASGGCLKVIPERLLMKRIHKESTYNSEMYNSIYDDEFQIQLADLKVKAFSYAYEQTLNKKYMDCLLVFANTCRYFKERKSS